MKHKVKVESILFLIEYGTLPLASWPLPPDASSFKVLLNNFLFWFGPFVLMAAGTGWLYKIYLNMDDVDIIIPIISEMGTAFSAITKMSICKLHARRLQNLVVELRLFLKEATKEEMKVVESYVDRCFIPHVTVLICAISCPIAFMLLPTVTAKTLPGNAEYWFSANSTWVYVTLYASHSYGSCMIGSVHILDFLFVIFIWLAGVKFQVLALEFEQAANVDDVKRCIRKHQEVLAYVERMNPVVRIMSLEVTVVAILTVTTGGFVLLRHPPWIVVLEYIFFEVISGLELYLFSWPADNLIRTSESIRDAAYGCAWVGKSPEMMQDLLIVMQRSGFPEVISVDGVLPPLTLEFFGSCMSASFSYLTTLRAMVND